MLRGQRLITIEETKDNTEEANRDITEVATITTIGDPSMLKKRNNMKTKKKKRISMNRSKGSEMMMTKTTRRRRIKKYGRMLQVRVQLSNSKKWLQKMRTGQQ